MTSGSSHFDTGERKRQIQSDGAVKSRRQLHGRPRGAQADPGRQGACVQGKTKRNWQGGPGPSSTGESLRRN